MRINVDRASCIGSGQCTVTAPAVFAQDENGISYVVRSTIAWPAEADPSSVREAETGCPVQAIRISEEAPDA